MANFVFFKSDLNRGLVISRIYRRTNFEAEILSCCQFAVESKFEEQLFYKSNNFSRRDWKRSGSIHDKKVNLTRQNKGLYYCAGVWTNCKRQEIWFSRNGFADAHRLQDGRRRFWWACRQGRMVNVGLRSWKRRFYYAFFRSAIQSVFICRSAFSRVWFSIFQTTSEYLLRRRRRFRRDNRKSKNWRSCTLDRISARWFAAAFWLQRYGK